MLAAAGLWSFVLLDRSPHWNPWLRFLTVAVALAGIAGIAAGSLTRRRLALPVGSLAVAAALLGPAAYSVQTVTTSHGGALVAAGPAAAQTRIPAAFEREAAGLAERSGFVFAFGGNVRPPGGDATGRAPTGARGARGGRPRPPPPARPPATPP